jgi:hypothetical protein
MSEAVHSHGVRGRDGVVREFSHKVDIVHYGDPGAHQRVGMNPEPVMSTPPTQVVPTSPVNLQEAASQIVQYLVPQLQEMNTSIAQGELDRVRSALLSDTESARRYVWGLTQRCESASTDITKLLSAIHTRLEELSATKRVDVWVHREREVVKLEGLMHRNFPKLLQKVLALSPSRRNVWLKGPASSGKSHSAEQLAEVLGLPFYQHGQMMMGSDLLGYTGADGRTYHGTPFRQGFEHGGVVLLDEVDSWDGRAALALNSSTSNGYASFPDQALPVRRHPDCYIICGANTWGWGATAQYSGRVKLDDAFLSRFAKVHWPIDEELEIKLAGVREWAEVVQKVRKAAKDAGSSMVISTRATLIGCDLIQGGCERMDVVEGVFGDIMEHSSWGVVGKAAMVWAGVGNG